MAIIRMIVSRAAAGYIQARRYAAAWLRAEWGIAAIGAIFVVATAAVASTWLTYQINPDATSYFTIAQKYARLDFSGAVNGYWGPLFSWLLVPAVWLHLNLEIAAYIISSLAGGAVLLVVYYFLRGKGAGRALANALCLVLGGTFAGWIVLGAISPDVIFTCWIVLFAVLLDWFMSRPLRRTAVWLGVVGAFMYFTKGFGLYLWIVMLAGVAAWHWRVARNGYRVVLRQAAPAIIVLAVLTVPFMAALSVKYHAPTVNTTGTYVHRAFGPVQRGDQPMLGKGPLAPPNATAHSVWEDPTLMVPLMRNWSPLESKQSLDYFLRKIVWHNLDTSAQTLKDASAVGGAAAVVLLVGCLPQTVAARRAAKARPAFRREHILLTALSLVTIGGYALVLTEPRYLWPAVVLAIIGLGLWLIRLEQAAIIRPAHALSAAGVVTVLWLLPMPAHIYDEQLSSTEIYQQAHRDIQPYLPRHAHVIADNFIQYSSCYYLQLHCYAVLQTPPPDGEAAYYRQLKAAGVDYFVDYHSRDADPRFERFIRTYFIEEHTVHTPHQHPLTPAVVTIYRLP